MNARISTSFLVILQLFALIEVSYQLECYVCQNQDDNKSKCTETVKICDLEQEHCLTEVRWGSIPYWALTGQKQHFISKRCATKQECQVAVADESHRCDRIWYNDWNCTTCCSGDKCNYYVTLAGRSSNLFNPYLTFFGSLISIMASFNYSAKGNKMIL